MTGNSTIDIIILIFNNLILIFGITIMSSYLILAFLSSIQLKRYMHENRFVNYDVLLRVDNAPKISIIAPAYNEGRTIEANVLSLLSLKYSNYEVIVVNDGSKDDSIEVLKRAFDLIPRKEKYLAQLPTKAVKEVYISSNPANSKLIVVDKLNGGKADALNTGINVSNYPFFVCIDVDCIMMQDALLKLAKPFMEQSERRVIATGGVIRVANSCVIKSGNLIEVKVPDNFLARVQIIEYLRSFILGRMAWSKLDGLLIISGAFGMFDKEIAIKSGGYNTKTVGEDMELIVRMRRYMIDQKQSYVVQYIPNPLCWTEVPESFSILRKQRSRWTRGTMETLWMHKGMFLNPKYKILGLLSFPYWFVYEYLAPFVEVIGLIVTLVLLFIGFLNVKFCILLFLFAYTFATMVSALALYAEETTYRQYKSTKDIRKLGLTVLLEPLIYHPFTVYSALYGNWEKLRGHKAWGEMTRTGFNQQTKK